MTRYAKYVLVLAAIFWANYADAQPPGRGERGEGGGPGMRGEGGGPGGRFGGGGPGGMRGEGGGPGGRFGGGGPGGMMGGRGGPGGMMPGGGPPGMMGGRGGPGGRDRGGRGFSPPGGGEESGEDRFARFEGMLRGFDANKDGVIDPREVPEDRRRFLGFIGARMGVDFSKPVSIDKLREKATQQFGGDKKKSEPEPLVPGFGVPQEEATVLAFGERPPEASSSGSSSRTSGRGGSGAEQNSRAAGFARMMMSRYDRDGNGVVERDKGEWEGIRGDPNEIDRNHDGRIDNDEMVARVSSYMGGDRGGDQGGGRGGDRGGDRGGEQKGDSKDDGRKSYRFLSASERLPDGLPDWFEERDGNEDGQVSMAEYSSYWSDSKAREYLRYDLNDDGIVTPDECLTAMSDPDFVAPVAATSESGSSEADSSDTGSSTGEAKPEEKKEASADKPWWEQ